LITKEFWNKLDPYHIDPMKTAVWWLPPQSEETKIAIFNVKGDWVTVPRIRHACTFSINVFKKSRVGQKIEFRANFKS